MSLKDGTQELSVFILKIDPNPDNLYFDKFFDLKQILDSYFNALPIRSKSVDPHILRIRIQRAELL